jgi:hypothetical protein
MRQRATSNGAFTCRKVAFCSKLYQKCDKGPQVIAHLLAEKSHFVQNLRNLYQKCDKATSNGAITCGKVGFCSKFAQLFAHSLLEKSDFEQNFIKNATRPQVMAHSLAEKSDFEQILRNLYQKCDKAASNCAKGKDKVKNIY